MNELRTAARGAAAEVAAFQKQDGVAARGRVERAAGAGGAAADDDELPRFESVHRTAKHLVAIHQFPSDPALFDPFRIGAVYAEMAEARTG